MGDKGQKGMIKEFLNGTYSHSGHFSPMSHSGWEAQMLYSCVPFCKLYKCWESDKLLSFHCFRIGKQLEREWKRDDLGGPGPNSKVKQHI